MKYTIVDKHDYLRADLLERERVEETEGFLDAILEADKKYPRKRLLICVHPPRAFFHIEKYNASRFLQELADRPDSRVALVARHFEVRILHQYVEALARLKRARLRSFGDEGSAIRWLMAPESAVREPTSAAQQ
jgi:hypothetical protein